MKCMLVSQQYCIFSDKINKQENNVTEHTAGSSRFSLEFKTVTNF